MVRKSQPSSQYISLKQATKISGYNQDYLGYLIREKKLTGERIGRDWFTTEKALRTYLSTKKFLSFRDFFSYRVKSRIIFITTATVLIGAVVFLISNSYIYSRIQGELERRTELQVKNLNIDRAGEGAKEVKITAYSLDTGETEITIQPDSAATGLEEKPSLLQKLLIFLKKYF